VQGANAITLVIGEEFASDISKSFKGFLFKKHAGLVEITIKSPQAIEETPGVVSYLYSLFAEHGINIVETLSCWTDTLFIIEEKDLNKAMEILKF
jgi:aspartokinase